MTDRLRLLLSMFNESKPDGFILFAIAKEYEGTNDKTSALEWYLKLRNSQPNYVGLYYHLGKLYESLNNTDDAIATYKEGIAVATAANDLHARSELAGALLNLEDPD